MSESKKVKLSEAEQARVSTILKRDSPQKVARRWNMADDALLRAANGYPVQRGTKSLIDAGLQKEPAE